MMRDLTKEYLKWDLGCGRISSGILKQYGFSKICWLRCNLSFFPIIARKLLKGTHHWFPTNSLHHILKGNNFDIPFFVLYIPRHRPYLFILISFWSTRFFIWKGVDHFLWSSLIKTGKVMKPNRHQWWHRVSETSRHVMEPNRHQQRHRVSEPSRRIIII